MEQQNTPEGFPKNIASILAKWPKKDLAQLEGRVSSLASQIDLITSGNRVIRDTHQLFSGFAFFCSIASKNETDAATIYNYFLSKLAITGIKMDISASLEHYESKSEETPASITADVLQSTRQLSQRLLEEKKD